LPGAGSLTDNGVGVIAGQFIPVADITSGLLQFAPAANANGSGYASFTFQVEDDGGTSNGGVNLDQSPNKMTINVTSVNDAPAGTDNTVTTLEDTAYVFAKADFGFTDPNDSPANNLLAVKISTIPLVGSFTDNGVGVIAGQFISLADITGGLLKFTPVANANGSGYASFTFQVEDDGGTANGGVNLDQSPNTMTINVTSVNDAPAGADKTVTTLEDTPYVFATSDFGFTDPNDSPANSLLAVKITALPLAGSLIDNSIAVIAGQFISVADITSGLLQFTPAANANGTGYASFTFQVEDNGGTANGGVDLDQSANKMTINVTSVNDAPAGTDNTVTTLEDTAYVFAKADFGFTDLNDSPANNLLAVKITTLPGAGSLTDNGVAVTTGQFISLSDITNSLLKFTPAANANGTGYASFTFQVEDDGGTLNGGVNLDQSANSMTINVTPVNDAPVLSGSNDPSFDHKTPAAVVADNAITITDIDSVNMSSATITITNAKSGDFLTYSGVLPGGITISGNNTTAITLSTNSSLANYDSVLKAITFNSTFNGAGPNRDINWTVTDDGSATSNTLTTHITITPVVLDLTGDGIHLVSASASHVTLGDVTGTTILNPIGWITSGEGVLMLDSNGNGTLTQFNQISFASYVPDAKTDLQGLVAFDTNHDGFLDAGDAQYNQFGVLLANGKFESLSQLGINNISLHSDNQAQLVNDNVVFGSSSYQGANGKSYQVADVGFTVGQVNKGVALQTSDVLLNPNHLDFNNLADNKSPDSSSAASHSPVSVAVDAPTAPIQAPQLPATVAGLSAPVSTETSPQTSSHSALSLVEIAHIQAQITMEHIEH
ncbi:MAG: hypothetical protein JSR17_11295, partial [Proteobacteria bacterium]|nr:hypothetical protein [Pseudomonadota bacterium]